MLIRRGWGIEIPGITYIGGNGGGGSLERNLRLSIDNLYPISPIVQFKYLAP